MLVGPLVQQTSIGGKPDVSAANRCSSLRSETVEKERPWRTAGERRCPEVRMERVTARSCLKNAPDQPMPPFFIQVFYQK